jgi:putative nucleotidyltransferase with HDIG domain
MVNFSVQEVQHWQAMVVQDRLHAIRVLARFDTLLPNASDEVRRGVLLHDVGKSVNRLGLVGRIAATVFGPVRPSWRVYLDHEQIGAEILRRSGSSTVTWMLVGGRGDPSTLRALRLADDE